MGVIDPADRNPSGYHRFMTVIPPPALESLRARRDEIALLVRRHRGEGFSVFGSVATGADRADSDIDFLVKFAPGSSLTDLLHLQDDLSQLLGRPVDVVSEAALKPRDGHILAEAIAI